MKNIPFPLWILLSLILNSALFLTVALSMAVMRFAAPSAPEGSMRVSMMSTMAIIKKFTPPPAAEIKEPAPPPIEKLFPKDEREKIREEVKKVEVKKQQQGVSHPLPIKATGQSGLPHPDANKSGISGPGTNNKQTAQPAVITGNNNAHPVTDKPSPAGNGIGGTDNVGPAPGGGTGGGEPKGVAVISLGRPGYSKTADDAKFSGAIVVSVTLDSNGKVVSADVSSQFGALDAACRAAAMKSRFDPATNADGEAIAATGKITFLYKNGALVDRNFNR